MTSQGVLNTPTLQVVPRQWSHIGEVYAYEQQAVFTGVKVGKKRFFPTSRVVLVDAYIYLLDTERGRKGRDRAGGRVMGKVRRRGRGRGGGRVTGRGIEHASAGC